MSKTAYKDVDLRRGTVLVNREKGYRATVSGFKDGDRVIVNLDSGMTHSFSKPRLLHFFDVATDPDIDFRQVPSDLCISCKKKGQLVGPYCFGCAEKIDFAKSAATQPAKEGVILTEAEKFEFIAEALTVPHDEAIKRIEIALAFRPATRETRLENFMRIARIINDPLSSHKGAAKVAMRREFGADTSYVDNFMMLFRQGGLPWRVPFEHVPMNVSKKERKAPTKMTDVERLKQKRADMLRQAKEIEQQIKEAEIAPLQNAAKHLLQLIADKGFKSWVFRDPDIGLTVKVSENQ